MFRARSILQRLLPLVLSASTAAVSLPTFAAAPRAISPPSLVARAALEAPASVLGLEGNDTKAAEELTAALRRAFEKRGYAGGEEITLAELRLTMGCEGNDMACLASGGEALQVRRLVYGSLSGSGGSYTLELSILNVGDGAIEKNIKRPVEADELQPDVIDATATEIVNAMFPDEADGDELPGPTGEAGTEPGDEPIADEPVKPRRSNGLVWGPYKPRPAWKWAAFGVSAGLMGLALVAVAVTGIPVAQSHRGKGFLYDKLDKKARESLMNGEPLDDVNPDLVVDICSDREGSGGALEQLDQSDGVSKPGVRNATVGQECRNGQTWARVTTASAAALGVFALTTAVFTTLLFVHRETPAANAMVEHRVSVGAGPNPQGRGVSFTGGFRF